MIKLVRIDHRLLHGQVVFSWTKSLGISRIIVVDDETANDEMKKSFLKLIKTSWSNFKYIFGKRYISENV